MASNQSGPGRRFASWLLASAGTLALGVTALWINHKLGPKPPYDPCSSYQLPPEDYLRSRVLEEWPPDLRKYADDPNLQPVMAVLATKPQAEHFARWAAECGKAVGIYEQEFPPVRLRLPPERGVKDAYTKALVVRLAPGAIFKDKEGFDCRLIDADMRWSNKVDSMKIKICRIEGVWR